MEQKTGIERDGYIFRAMVIAGIISKLECINYCKIGLYSTSIFILQDLRPFIFKPIFFFSICMAGKARHIRFSCIRCPIYTISRTKVVSYATIPIIYNQIILHTIFPNDRVFKATIYLGVDGFIAYLTEMKAISTHPNTTTTAHHQKRAI